MFTLRTLFFILLVVIIIVQTNGIQIRQVEDKWIWGNVNLTTEGRQKLEHKPQKQENATTSGQVAATGVIPDEKDAAQNCSIKDYKPKKPDFGIGTKRISESKCNEYLWNIVKSNYYEALHFKSCFEEGEKPGIAMVPIIVGGVDAEPLAFPHMVAIAWKGVSGEWYFLCGGTLISPNFVLTAAHCSKASSVDTRLAETTPKKVRLGQTKLSDNFYKYPGTDRNIKRIMKHPDYEPPKKYFDIALIEFDQDVEFSASIQPACLWTKPDFKDVAKPVTITGWGVTTEKSTTTVNDLQVGDVNIIDSKQCGSLLQSHCNRLWCGLKENQMCAGRLQGGVDTCQGDSGGPLQVPIDLGEFEQEGNMYYVIGVTSFGIGCARAESPGIYTRVSSFIDWIEPIVWPGK